MLSERLSHSEVIDYMNSKFTYYNIYSNLSILIDCLLSTLSILIDCLLSTLSILIDCLLSTLSVKIELIQTYLYLWFLLGAQVYAT